MKRTDDNQKEIVKNLRKIGCSVHITSNLGHGFADICVGIRGKNYLFEIKNGKKYPSQQILTPHEQHFFLNWKGQITVIRSIDDAIAIMTI